jgi:hypothetical protein
VSTVFFAPIEPVERSRRLRVKMWVFFARKARIIRDLSPGKLKTRSNEVR